MRLMILRAALFAADADIGAGAPEATDGSETTQPSSAEPAAPESSPATTDAASRAPAAPAPTAAGEENMLRTAGMAMPVIVRKGERLLPGIVVEEDAGHGLTVQVFHGDHGVHVAHAVARTEPSGTDDGWFFPWEPRPAQN